MLKDKSDNTHTNRDNVLKCWQEHSEAHLNTRFPHQPEAMLDIPPPPLGAETQGEITTEEIKKAIANMKNRKAPGIDGIAAEVLKAGGNPIVVMLHKIFNTIYDTEKRLKDWARMMVTPIHKKVETQTPANYRAISLLSIPGKEFSRVLLSRMHKNNISGYRRDSVWLQTRPWNGR